MCPPSYRVKEYKRKDTSFDEDEGEEEANGDERYDRVPTIMPRSCFSGACNVETVKDGAYLGDVPMA